MTLGLSVLPNIAVAIFSFNDFGEVVGSCYVDLTVNGEMKVKP
jgi:hypothetical protein